MSGALRMACAVSVAVLACSGCSEEKSTPFAPDLTAPAPLGRLSASAVSDSSVGLNWDVPDGESPAWYEIAYTTDPSVLALDGGWNACAKDSLVAVTGNERSHIVSELSEATTYYFAVKRYDAAGNGSQLSTQASARTDESPPIFESQWGALGSGPGEMLRPSAIAWRGDVYDGEVYVADAGNYRILKFDSRGMPEGAWGSKCDLFTGEGCIDPDGSGPLQLGHGQFGEVTDLAVDVWGSVYVADGTNHRIVKFTSSGQFIAQWPVAIPGSQWTERPEAMAIDPDGRMYVSISSFRAAQLIVFRTDGTCLGTIWPQGLAWDGPFEVASDGQGHLYLSTLGEVVKVSTSGAVLQRWDDNSTIPCARGGAAPAGRKATDLLGNVYVANRSCSRIQKFDGNGAFLTSWGGYGTEDGQFKRPIDVAIGVREIYVLDDDGETPRVKKFRSRHTSVWNPAGRLPEHTAAAAGG